MSTGGGADDGDAMLPVPMPGQYVNFIAYPGNEAALPPNDRLVDPPAMARRMNGTVVSCAHCDAKLMDRVRAIQARNWEVSQANVHYEISRNNEATGEIVDAFIGTDRGIHGTLKLAADSPIRLLGEAAVGKLHTSLAHVNISTAEQHPIEFTLTVEGARPGCHVTGFLPPNEYRRLATAPPTTTNMSETAAPTTATTTEIATTAAPARGPDGKFISSPPPTQAATAADSATPDVDPVMQQAADALGTVPDEAARKAILAAILQTKKIGADALAKVVEEHEAKLRAKDAEIDQMREQVNKAEHVTRQHKNTIGTLARELNSDFAQELGADYLDTANVTMDQFNTGIEQGVVPLPVVQAYNRTMQTRIAELQAQQMAVMTSNMQMQRTQESQQLIEAFSAGERRRATAMPVGPTTTGRDAGPPPAKRQRHNPDLDLLDRLLNG